MPPQRRLAHAASVAASLVGAFLCINVAISVLYLPRFLHIATTLPSKHSAKHKRSEATGHPRLPNVLLIGAQKAGTTALANWLFHYGICSPRVLSHEEPKFYRKEVHFFDEDERYNQGAGFYAQRFVHCANAAHSDKDENMFVLAMDATPKTMLYADRVRQTYEQWDSGSMLGNVKILVMLREPTARELSWYNHIRYKCQNDGFNGFEQPQEDKSSIASYCRYSNYSYSEYVREVTLKRLDVATTDRLDLNRGHYAHLLREWIQLFDRKQILILSYDELVKDEGMLAHRVEKFLGLHSRNNPGRIASVNVKDDETKVRQANCDTQKQLDDAFAPLNDALYELLEKNPGPDMEKRPFPRFEGANCTAIEIKR